MQESVRKNKEEKERQEWEEKERRDWEREEKLKCWLQEVDEREAAEDAAHAKEYPDFVPAAGKDGGGNVEGAKGGEREEESANRRIRNHPQRPNNVFFISRLM